MSAPRIKLRGSGYYHIYSRFVLGELLLGEKKKMKGDTATMRMEKYTKM